MTGYAATGSAWSFYALKPAWTGPHAQTRTQTHSQRTRRRTRTRTRTGELWCRWEVDALFLLNHGNAKCDIKYAFNINRE